MKAFANSPEFVRKNQQNTQQNIKKSKAFKNAQRRVSETKGIGSSRGSHGPIPSIELYQREDCPGSHSVRNRLTRLGLDFVAHNVPAGNALKHDQLVKVSGKDQVPFLIDHTSGVKLFESASIIAYLDKIYGQPSITIVQRIANGIDARLRARADQIAWTLKAPLTKVSDLRGELEGALKQFRGSFEFIKDRVQETLKARAASGSGEQATPSAAMRAKGAKASTVRANVSSVTEAA